MLQRKECYSEPDIDRLLLIASFLDPKFKLGYLDDQESVLEEVKAIGTSIWNETDSVAAADASPASKIAKGLS